MLVREASELKYAKTDWVEVRPNVTRHVVVLELCGHFSARVNADKRESASESVFPVNQNDGVAVSTLFTSFESEFELL